MDKRKALTLVELLLVVAILGVLAAIAIPKINASSATAKDNACATNLDILNSQIENYAANNDGTYPGTLSDIASNSSYFPDGAPSCPLGGTYTMDANSHRVSCSH